MTADLSRLSLIEANEGLAAGRFRSRDLVEACVAAVEARDGAVNSFIRWDFAEARTAADAADRSRTAGSPVLHGIPLAHKDMFYREGRISTCGSRILADRPAPATATVLRRLDAEGALDLGTLNMSEFAAGPTGHNAHYGPVRNPWNGDHISGGSSSGSAGAVAARLCFGALGSDTGASIRVPAACCGLVGIKPTYGRISRYAAMPRSWSNDCIGPLTRTAEDCAILLQAIAGQDPKDPSSLPAAVPDYRRALAAGVSGLRIAVPRLETLPGVQDHVADALEASRRVLEAAGCTLVECALPDLEPLYLLGETLAKAEASTIHRRWLMQCPEQYGAHVRTRLEAGLALPVGRYLEALSLRSQVLKRFLAEVLGDADVLHLPVLGTDVPTIAETDFHGSGTVQGTVSGITRYTRPINYLGLPAVSVPCGFSSAGLPLAFQLVGRSLDEDRLLALAHAYQQRTDWHRAEPPVIRS